MKTTRNTQQKKIIMDALMHADHPTASALYELIHPSHPRISRATVFRVLAQYAESGEVLKVTLSDGSARFDARLAPHAHARCLNCGRVFDICGDEVSEILASCPIKDFEVSAASVEYEGRCGDCAKKTN